MQFQIKGASFAVRLSAILGATALLACSQTVASSPDESGTVNGDADDADDGIAADDTPSDTGPSRPKGSKDDGTSRDSGVSDAAPSAADDGGLGGWTLAEAGADASALPVVAYSKTIGPITLQPGEETTVCMTVRLDNPDAVYVPRITVDLAPGSHHLVTYRSAATVESPMPTPCTGFAGILGGNAVPLMISQKAHDELTFPAGVALKIQPHQMVLLEAHYINPNARALQGQGTVHFETMPLSVGNVTESDLAFWGTTNIAIGAHSAGSVGPLFKAAIAGTHGFAVTTHQHRLGTRFQIWYSKNAADVNHTPIADTTDWANAPLYRVSPEMTFDGSNGLSFKCEWNNTTDSLISFGESALQEMCFLWMYYYPSHGFDMRLN